MKNLFFTSILFAGLSFQTFSQGNSGNSNDNGNSGDNPGETITSGDNSNNGNTRWKLDGNMLEGEKFIGTLNEKDLIFKSNNIEGLRITPAKDFKVPGLIYMDHYKTIDSTKENFLTVDYTGKLKSLDRSGLTKALIGQIYLDPCGETSDGDGSIIPVWASKPEVNGYGILWTGETCAPARVGIGTENPEATLDVIGNTNITGSLSIGILPSNYNARLHIIQPYTQRNGLTVELTSTSPSATGVGANIVVNSDNRKAFAVYNNLYQREVFRVMGDGQV